MEDKSDFLLRQIQFDDCLAVLVALHPCQLDDPLVPRAPAPRLELPDERLCT
jgi:hypothetical protein